MMMMRRIVVSIVDGRCNDISEATGSDFFK